MLVSPVSAWEIGLLASSPKSGLRFLPTPRDWFARVLRMPGIRLTPLIPEAAIEASFLPGDFHRDPADRLLIATARHLGAALITRDRMLLAYAEQGHVQVIAC
ncbi:MAG: type II toxin-antitoxin system VapC family toxin [Geminicoccaceae bacterium]